MNRATRSQGESPPRNNPESPKVASLVIGLQTHDSVGNHPHGKRIHHLTSKSFQKAAAGLTLLYPGIPLLFMGEEYAVDAPFPFFVDFEDPTLREGVDQGRAQEFPHGTWGDVLSPIDAEAFYNAKCHQADDLDLDVFAWYQQLIKLRKQGIAQGWLTAECLTVGHDPNSDLFSLQYECGAEGSIVVLARLTNPETSSAESVQVRLEGPLLLSSELNPEIDNGHVVLGSNHAVISKSPA
jgi:1,4-alpha-glucan branching enzyme